jgi:hypothetical protein
MVLYSCLLIIFLLCRESLEMILVDETPPWGGSITSGSGIDPNSVFQCPTLQPGGRKYGLSWGRMPMRCSLWSQIPALFLNLNGGMVWLRDASASYSPYVMPSSGCYEADSRACTSYGHLLAVTSNHSTDGRWPRGCIRGRTILSP